MSRFKALLYEVLDDIGTFFNVCNRQSMDTADLLALAIPVGNAIIIILPKGLFGLSGDPVCLPYHDIVAML